MRPDTISIFFIATSRKATRFVRKARSRNLASSWSQPAQFELTPRPLTRIGAVSLQSMTKVEFVILVSCNNGMKRLAGRRRTIGQTLVEKNAGYWGTRWREARIEHRSMQSTQNWNRRHRGSSITIEVLSHGLRITTLGRDSVSDRQPEGAGR